MIVRKLVPAFLLAVVVGAGTYLFVYLYRWEWNRALTAGVFVLIAEVALVAIVLGERLRRIENRLMAPDRPVDRADRTLARLQASAPPAAPRFDWIKTSADRTSVFVPVLMGAGVVMSGLAWLVERLARATARPQLERGLAARMAALSFDSSEGLVPPPGSSTATSSVPAVLLAPGSRR